MQQIKHLHLLLRAECATAPGPNDEQKIYDKIVKLVKDVKMQVFMEPKVVYMDIEGNEGLTGIVGLETSHSSQHFWDKPDQSLMQYKEATLLNFDLYTCGCLGLDEIKVVLDYISEFEPKLVNLLLFDRARHDSFDHPVAKIQYDKNDSGDYQEFLSSLQLNYTQEFKDRIAAS